MIVYYVMYPYEGKFGERYLAVNLFRDEEESMRFAIKAAIEMAKEMKVYGVEAEDLVFAEEALSDDEKLDDAVEQVCVPCDIELGSQEI